MRTLTFCLLLSLIAVTGCRKNDNSPGNGKNPATVVPEHFLSDSKYDQLTVEIQYIQGHAPTAATINNLKAFLSERLNKPGGITVIERELASQGKTTYSIADIRSIESLYRTVAASNKLTAYIFFADADYSENNGSEKVLGVAYGSSSMAVFEKTVREFSGGFAQPPVTTLETTVTLHEFSHILGLVNNGTALQSAHQDEPNGKHCKNKDCLMYYAAETSNITANILGGNVPDLDAACIADLRANGGR